MTPGFKFSLDPPPAPRPFVPRSERVYVGVTDDGERILAENSPDYILLTALDGETGWVKKYVPPTHLESNHPTPEWERAYWRRRGAA